MVNYYLLFKYLLCQLHHKPIASFDLLETQSSVLFPSIALALRHPNNYSASFRNQVLEVAKAVKACYGEAYDESVSYLEALARNRFFREATWPRLRFHEMNPVAPGVGAPVYQLHPTVIQALAPGVALRAAFGGRRG